MRTTRWLAVIALVAAVVLHAGRAWAPFHVVVIDQVFFGTEDCPNAQYVMMRLLSPGMSIFGGQRVRTQNADGGEADDFGTFADNLSNSADDAHAIIGTADAAGLFGIEMDQGASGQLVFADGRVCFAEFPPGSGTPVDCVAYGNFTGDNGSGGAPAPAPVLGMALVRQSTMGEDSTAFALGAPAPRNNAGDSGVLGVCPGGAETPTPTVAGDGTPTPTGEPIGCVGDCDDTQMVSIGNLIRGVNISLGLQALSSCEAFDCMGDGTVTISCLIQGVNNALNGCP